MNDFNWRFKMKKENNKQRKDNKKDLNMYKMTLETRIKDLI